MKADRLKNLSRKKKILLVVVLLIIVIGAYRIVSGRLEDKSITTSDIVNIKVQTAELTTLENTSPLTGRLEPVEEVTIMPKSVGEVTNVYVTLGDKVTKGTVLFELDKTQIATSYNQAKASYNDAKMNLDRIAALYKEGAVSLQQYEQAQTAFTIAQESFISAGDGMNNCNVTSPIDGYITSINVAPGALASQSVAAATVANIDKLEIETSVAETMINKIKLGDKVQVVVSSVSDKPFTGTITALSPAPATGSLTYPLKVTLDNSTASVKPGMFAEVIITSDKTANVIAVPSTAVLIKSGKTVVAEIENGKKVVFKKVVVGVDNGKLAEIKSGVKVGETIVVEGQYYLEKNSKFNIVE